ncbi:hypothetical protein I4F81_012927 [Pyropia yezoensis]|uniref:Secreted protein n=1 Tax=Pyropia yezoensis TaxID=2788 RepID=A0ABQ9T857_PYRYE|nr:hypothetical protein I4F81_012927 [Neopyropia yezoensis]
MRRRRLPITAVAASPARYPTGHVHHQPPAVQLAPVGRLVCLPRVPLRRVLDKGVWPRQPGGVRGGSAVAPPRWGQTPQSRDEGYAR